MIGASLQFLVMRPNLHLKQKMFTGEVLSVVPRAYVKACLVGGACALSLFVYLKILVLGCEKWNM